MEDMYILWKKCDGGACVYAIYGENGETKVPQYIDNIPVVGIGDYCFAQSDKVPSDCIAYGNLNDNMRRQNGNYIDSIEIPDKVVRIGNFAFYNCTNLKSIDISSNLREVGSDVFMNCAKLHEIKLRCMPDAETGLKQILGRISWDVNVKFEMEGKVYAQVFYPEYYENYDEIAPAHIFGRNIEGEGFRARQGFDGLKINMQQYDAVFEKACCEESRDVLSKMALNRLIVPFWLGKREKISYEEFVKNNDEEVAKIIVRDRWREALDILCERKLLSEKALNTARVMANESGWSEGAVSLLRMKQTKKDIRKRYEL